MIGLRYNGDFLDVDTDAALTFELNNIVFSSADSSRLPGSFSFPYTLPGTARNRTLLNYPDRIDNSERFDENGAVDVYYHGKVIFRGLLKVTEASDTIKVYIVANPLSTLKTVPLNELDLGGERTFTDAAELIDHAKDTATDPLDYDYIFFPVYNLGFLTNESSEKQRWMNFYNGDTEAFEPDTDAPGFMPFIRLEYLLERMFESEEYTFVNDWQVIPDLRKITLYNHRTLFNDGALETTIDLRNHVPDTKATDLLRKIVGNFNLGLFYNPWTKQLRLIPLRDLINRPPAHDWTSKALGRPSIRFEDGTVPRVFRYDDVDGDNIQERYRTRFPKPEPSEVLGTVDSLPLLDATGTAGLYYVTSEAQYWLRIIGVGGTRNMFWGDFLPAPVDTGTPEFVSDLHPLFNSAVAFIHGQASADAWMLNAPVIEAPGTIRYSYTPPGGDPTTVDQKNKNPLRITVYRGFASGTPYSGYGSRLTPFACYTPYNPGGIANGTLSLRWEGPYGLYEQWWKGWHSMLLDGKNIVWSVRLTLADIINFNFQEKVRIQNQDFFVKKMRITLTPRGLAPVEVELVSTI